MNRPKTKNRLLVTCFVLILFMCYQLAISKTVDKKRELKALTKELSVFKNAPEQLYRLKRKEMQYDSILSKYQFNGSSIQNNLLKILNTFSINNNIEIYHFKEPHIIIKDELTIKTYEFTIRGSYNDIIQLIYHLEQKTKLGEIINLHLEKMKNFKNGVYYLQAKVLLQSFS